jgi:hypothetical protein
MGYGVIAAVLLLLLVLSARRKRQPPHTFARRTGPVLNNLDIVDPHVVTDTNAATIEQPALPAVDGVSYTTLDLDELRHAEDNAGVHQHPTGGETSDQASDHSDERSP